MTPCAANRSRGMNASRTATCWRCTSVWRNCVSSTALRRGGCRALYAEGDVVVFVRVYQQRALVAINRGEACEVALEALPLLNVAGWQCKTGSGDIREEGFVYPRFPRRYG